MIKPKIKTEQPSLNHEYDLICNVESTSDFSNLSNRVSKLVINETFLGIAQSQQSSLQIDIAHGCECQPSIMIVDDNEFNIMSARLLLDDYSIQIDTAPNGEIAVRKFDESLSKQCGC